MLMIYMLHRLNNAAVLENVLEKFDGMLDSVRVVDIWMLGQLRIF